MPGYDLNVNGDYARIESLKCPACELILRDAIQTEQGVRLCRSCYDDIQRYISGSMIRVDFVCVVIRLLCLLHIHTL